jgi:hypothetical protein
MKNLKNTFTALTGLVATALIVGCHPTPIAHGEEFYGNNDATCVGKLSQAQSSAGAKDDAMLYDQNFHGSELNSLGQGKLDLIAKGTPVGDPVKVYLDMPHDQVALRQAAVTSYLKSDGVDENKIIVVDGPNPNPSTPTAYNIGGVYKADGGSLSGAAVTVDSATGGAGAPSGGSH